MIAIPANFKIKKILLLHGITFLAAFLLFQIELIIAKIFLPKFGGSYLVWGACVVFFQGILLLGYLYSHLIINKFGVFRYRYFHLILVLLPLLFFPGRPLPAILSEYNIPIVFIIFWQLLLSIGLVFFVLSTTSIIFQRWLADSQLPERTNPYVLYAMSNLGSFAALLSYPFFFEMFFDLNTQLIIWRISYLILVLLHLSALRLIEPDKEKRIAKSSFGAIGGQDTLRWFLLSAATVIMFLSVTNIITYEVAPIPLLWIIPLSIYLFSFVLNFKKVSWCPNWIREKFHLTAGLSIILFFLTEKRILPFMIVVMGYMVSLFIICMFCNNELLRHKPSEARNLTTFYLILSAGGFTGGMFIIWFVPLLSTFMIEYPFGLLLISLALAIGKWQKRLGAYNLRLIIYVIFMVTFWPLLFKGYNVFGLYILFVVINFVYHELKSRPNAFSVSLLALLLVAPSIHSLWQTNRPFYTRRNYYGIYKIYDQIEKRFLANGTTLHGAQYLVREREKEPLTYYHHLTPVGKLMTSNLFNFSRVGLIGLGTGALASYSNANMVMDFFELDPDVYNIAGKYFTYLKNSSGKLNFIFGDARLSLNKIPKKFYDLLVIDAFSGDSIPAHLLTLEAIEKYRECLKDDGVILFHISNRYFDLAPVLSVNARAVHSYASYNYNKKSAGEDAFASSWVAFTWDKAVSNKLNSQLKWAKLNAKNNPYDVRAWTDQYSNIIPTIRIQDLLSQIKGFQPFYWDFETDRERIFQLQYYFSQGNDYVLKKEFTRAISYYYKALELSPKDDFIYFNIGKSYAALGQYDTAIVYYQKAIEINPDNAKTLGQLGLAYNLKGYPQKALTSFLKAKELFQIEEDEQNVKQMGEQIDKLQHPKSKRSSKRR